ncbi:MAG: sporulation integral membrane protein YtvI [Limnochordaceae bacterium]|nr:sporulation integral membrane protein YtvI [Limnochordaceae bacterium]
MKVPPYLWLIIGLVLVLWFHAPLTFLFSRLLMVLLPFLLGGILAALLEPTVRRLEQHGLRRSWATALTMLLALAVVGYILTGVGIQVAREITELNSSLKQVPLADATNNLIGRISEFYRGLPENVVTAINQNVNELYRRAQDLVQWLASAAITWAGQLPLFFMVLILVVISSYFFARDWSGLWGSLLTLFPPGWAARARQVGYRIRQDLLGYIRGELLMMLVTATIAAIGLYVLGVRYWMTMAVLIGLLDLLPVLGPPLILFPWAGALLLMGQYRLGLSLLALYAVMFAVRQLSEASVLGHTVGIHPLLMLFGVYGGLVAFGAWGVFIGPVLVITGRALFHAWLASRSASADGRTSRPPGSRP